MASGTCLRRSCTVCPEVLCSGRVNFPSLLLRPHVPVPKPLPSFAFTLAAESLQLGPSAAGLRDLPDVTSPESFTGCLDLYPGSLWSASTRFFPQSIGLPQRGSGSALSYNPCNDFCTGTNFGAAVISLCSGLQLCLPPRSFLPTQLYSSRGSRGVYFRAPYELLPPHTSDMLAVRFRAIDGKGLSPF